MATLSLALARCALRTNLRATSAVLGGFRTRTLAAAPLFKSYWRRSLSSQSPAPNTAEFSQSWDEYKKFFKFPPASPARDFELGRIVTVHGFLCKRRDRSAKLSFVDVAVDDGPRLQLCSEWDEQDSPAHLAHKELRSVPAWSPVSVTARVSGLDRYDNRPARSWNSKYPPGIDKISLELLSIQVLNPWPKDIIVSEGVRFPQTARHLQLRFSDDLRERMRFREHLKSFATDCLRGDNLCETETPLLFKSTPEGAREFLVPTRRPGLAYALPQSPQQYKQALMAAGFGGYFQFARCFRDEDLRADRQPEFTQLDLEMSFATGEDVMVTVERLITRLYGDLASNFVQHVGSSGEEWYPVRRDRQRARRGGAAHTEQEYPALVSGPFPRISYQEAMSLHGSDKPDLRIPGQIERVDNDLMDSLMIKMTSLDDPIIEFWRCNFPAATPKETRQFLIKFLESLPGTLAHNPDGEPVVLIYDSSKPLHGLACLGFVGAATLADGMEEGGCLIMQARRNRPFEGGSTALGAIRAMLYNEAVAAGLLPPNQRFEFLWVTGFPMFTPNNEVDPGQGGSAEFSATHHPFTAPLTSEDFELLATDPLRAKADHYDLVVNGMELGGGSRRIHVAHVQEFVFRNILKMTDQGVGQFRHLLEALRAGCPPHAGFALGFDRLAAVLSGTISVRDVIAFPKTMKGEEPFSGSPSPLTESQLETYHLLVRKDGGKEAR
ncbi:aspartyl-tRNA synthetase [Magnaporthiopsis poae ATCC 64411]|uniref:Aspartyl-tRNA synthetase n=1 Tax=Magnaporthiopsis poae (strain ATCC 64411 / 73-15) TaxID=644358 RepID=A0A0C4E5D6_MAGP6|nr:aspartyl-tRNA synthetase [Magnaporthiopsis poae ATCC 64411]